MDAAETPSAVTGPLRPAQDASQSIPLQPATAPLPPPLRGLYASPKGPCVLIYFPEQHETGLPLVPRRLETTAEPVKPLEPTPKPAAEPTLEAAAAPVLPFRCKFRFTSATGLLIVVIVRLALSAPLGDGWATRRIGPVHLSARIDS